MYSFIIYVYTYTVVIVVIHILWKHAEQSSAFKKLEPIVTGAMMGKEQDPCRSTISGMQKRAPL